MNTIETEKKNMFLAPSTEAVAEPIITLLIGMFWIFIVFV